MFQRTACKWRAQQQFARAVQNIKPALFNYALLVGCLVGQSSLVQAGEAIQIKAGHILTADLPVHHFEYSARKDKVLHYYIVQFNRSIMREDQLNLTTLGAKIVRYLPDDILVVHSTDKIARTIAGSSLSVQAVSPYRPEWKLSPELVEPVSAAIEQPAVSTEINCNESTLLVARLFPLEDGDHAAQSLRESSSLKLKTFSGRTLAFNIKCSDLSRAARTIAQSEAVEWVQMGRQIVDADKKPLPLRLRDLFATQDGSSKDGLKKDAGNRDRMGSTSAETFQKLAWTDLASPRKPFALSDSSDSYDVISQQIDEFAFSKPEQLLLFTATEASPFAVRAAKNALVLRPEQLPAVETIRNYLSVERKIQVPSAALIKGVALHLGLDLKNASSLAGAVIVDDRAGIGAKEVHEYNLHVTGPSNLCATLSYTDAPAAIASVKTLVNDLDLILVDSSGKETPLDIHDANAKKLEIPVAAGDYRVLVKGSSVPQGIQGKQPYALIVSLEN